MKRSTLHPVRGFTLVEMLVVIAIIAVLVTIVVGVSQIVIARASVERTRVNMQVIRQAIGAYYDVKKIYPPEEPSSAYPVTWTDGSTVSPPTPTRRQRNWNAYCRGKRLYNDLKSVPQARAHIASLSKDAIMYIWDNNVFIDGFDKYMDYRIGEGVGGTPVVISAGGDSDFTTEKDNLRSDGQ